MNKKPVIIYFLIILIFPAHCYIDPGTGSMLFAVLIGIVSTVFFTLKSLFIKIRTLPLWYKKDGVPDSHKNAIVIYSEGKQYWNVFKPVCDELIKRELPFIYYTSDESDPGLEQQNDWMKSSFIGRGNKAYSRLNMLEADLCLMTTPGLDVYQLKRSRGVKHYSHILHAPDDATFYRLFGLDYFDSVLLTGEYQKKAIRELEKKRGIKEKELHVVGCTYLDILKSKINSLPVPEKKGLRVLVSPSWGDNGILKKYGLKLLKPLAESGLSVIIRPHPQSSISEKEVLDSLKISLQVFENIEWDFERENISSMNRSDVMISDFSGIIFDYFFLFGRPVLFTGFDFDKRAYDVSDVDEEPWKFRVLKEIGIELYEDRFHSIADLIETAVKDSSLKEKITEARNTAYQYPGMAGIRCADVIQDLLTRLNPKSSL